MKKISLFIILFSAISTFSQSIDSTKEIRKITLSGSGYELGLQHGTLLKTEIEALIKKMKLSTANNIKEANQVFKKFFEYTQFTDTIKKYTPELFEEVRGIADGSGQTMNDILALNLIDEFWVYMNALTNHHCSALGANSVNGSAAYIAQNIDLEKYADGYQILVRLTKTATRPEQLLITQPGSIAFIGMNESGVGVCTNTLMQLKASEKGLPVLFVVRQLLNFTEKKDILNFIQSVPHASGQNYLIGIKGEVIDFEASSGKVVLYNPKNSNGTVCHTNHPLVNDNLKSWFEYFNPNATEKPVTSNTYIRLASVQNRISEKEVIDEELIKTTLRSKDDLNNPVCRSINNPGGAFTFSSVIMTLTGIPFLQITRGSPDQSDYVRIDF